MNLMLSRNSHPSSNHQETQNPRGHLFLLTLNFRIILWIMQGGYIGHLFSSNADRVNAASDVGSHFILSNLFHFAFIMLFVRSHFGWAELMLILNWFNLTSLYYRYNTYARFIHAPVVSGPLAWTFVAIFWNGALMVPHPTTLVARIFGNIFIWVIFLYGMFYLSVYKVSYTGQDATSPSPPFLSRSDARPCFNALQDYTMGLSLSVLMASLGVHQFLSKVIALQWIFAFVIMAVLFVATMSIAVPVWNGKEIKFRRTQPDEERAPLLNEGTTS